MASPNLTTSNDSIVHEAHCFHNDSDIIRAFRVAPFVPIMFFSLTGNPLVLAVVCKNKNMRKTINFFIANMALSDLLFTIVYIPRIVTILLFGYKWLLSDLAGRIFCKTVPFLMEISIIVSVLTVVVISLDRFLAVTFPLRTFITAKRCAFITCVMWSVALSVRIPALMATELDEYEGDTYCVEDMDLRFGPGTGRPYFKCILIALYGIPVSMILVLNSAIVIVIHRRKMPGNNSSVSFIRRQDETNRKVLRMVLIVVAAFILCWSLYFVFKVLRENDVHVSCNFLYLRLVLAHFNAALTPWLYAILSENYRRGFADILSKMGCLIFVVPQDRCKMDSSSHGRNNSARHDSQLGFQLQTLERPQYGSTAQLLN